MNREFQIAELGSIGMNTKVINLDGESLSVWPILNHKVIWKWSGEDMKTVTKIESSTGNETTFPVVGKKSEMLQDLIRQFFGADSEIKQFELSATKNNLELLTLPNTRLKVESLDIRSCYDDLRLEQAFWEKMDPDYNRRIVIKWPKDFIFDLPIVRKAEIISISGGYQSGYWYRLINCDAKIITIDIFDASIQDVWELIPLLLTRPRPIGFCLNVVNITDVHYEKLKKCADTVIFEKKWINKFPCINLSMSIDKELNIYFDSSFNKLRCVVAQKGTADSIPPPNAKLSIASIMAIAKRVPFTKQCHLAHRFPFFENNFDELPRFIKTLTFQFNGRNMSNFEADNFRFEKDESWNNRLMTTFADYLMEKTVENLTFKGDWDEGMGLSPILVTGTFTVERINTTFRAGDVPLNVELDDGCLKVDGVIVYEVPDDEEDTD